MAAVTSPGQSTCGTRPKHFAGSPVPLALTPTRRGLVPHLLNTDSLLKKKAVLVPLDNLYPLLETLLERPDIDARRALALESSVIVLDPVQPTSRIDRASASGRDHVNIWTEGGTRKISLDMLSRIVGHIRPDYVVAPYYRVSDAEKDSKKGRQRRKSRNAEYIRRFLHSEVGEALLVPIYVSGSWVGEPLTLNSDPVEGEVLDHEQVKGTAFYGQVMTEIPEETDGLAIRDIRTALFRDLPSHLPKAVLQASLTPRQLATAVQIGFNVFQSLYPQRLAEEGKAFNLHSDSYEVDIFQMQDSTYFEERSTLAEKCPCYTCAKRYSMAYIHHLLVSHEMLGTALILT